MMVINSTNINIMNNHLSDCLLSNVGKIILFIYLLASQRKKRWIQINMTFTSTVEPTCDTPMYNVKFVKFLLRWLIVNNSHKVLSFTQWGIGYTYDQFTRSFVWHKDFLTTLTMYLMLFMTYWWKWNKAITKMSLRIFQLSDIFINNEWLIVVRCQVNNFSIISWRKKTTIWWDNPTIYRSGDNHTNHYITQVVPL
jgi:hypothetical protein